MRLMSLLKCLTKRTLYAYADVRAQNPDLLMIIYDLKNKIKLIEKEKNVNTKFDKSETSGALIYVTPLPKHIAVKAKNSVESSNSVRRPQSKDIKSKNRVLNNTNAKSSTAHV
ncbi:hypothetical protein Tco_1219548 [Tanacetum coccineum]